MAAPESYSVGHDHVLSVAPIGVLANDTDPDGDTAWLPLVRRRIGSFGVRRARAGT